MTETPIVQPLPPIPPPPPPYQVPPSTGGKAIVALILGILSLTCCGFFTGIPAILLGKSEMAAVDAGKSIESNRIIAKIGMILGIIGSVLSLLGVIFYAALFALGIAGSMMQS